MGSKLKKIALPLAAVAIGGPLAAKAMAGTGAGSSLFGTALKAGLSGPTTAGSLGIGGAFAPLKGKLATGIMAGLANPISAKGAMTYGGLGALGSLMSKDKKKKIDTSKDDDAAQAAYDYHMMMSKGIMSPEDARKAFATYGKGMKGDYTPGTEMGAGRYEELYPQLNYTGLTKYNPNPNEMLGAEQAYKKKLREYNPYVMAPGMADGGMIDPLEEMPIITPMETEEERRMREAMEQIKMLQAEGFDFSQGNPVPDPYAEEPMTSMNYEGRADGGLMQVASAPDPMAERFDMLENLALDMYKRPLEELQPKEIEVLEGMIDMMDQGMADGGSVPQTKSIPQGMQIDGRGGGFIPMGAKEKHDDVPAMLAKNEFVMTSDAVKAAGGGSVNKGAQVMYDLMNSLESKV